MGLIKSVFNAVTGAIGGTLNDQWKDAIRCNNMDENTLMVKVSNNVGSKDIVSNGSRVIVNEGQMLIMVDNGRIVDVSAEAGAYTFDKSSSSSLFMGDFKGAWAEAIERFTYAGQAAKEQACYFINIKEILNNKFGTATPVSYSDPYYNFTVYIRFYGVYSFKITDPIAFFKSIAGNKERYTKSELLDALSTSFLSALTPALTMLSDNGICFNKLPQKQFEVSKAMRDVLDDDWRQSWGVEVANVAIQSISPDDESRAEITKLDKMYQLRDGKNAAAFTVLSQGEAMQSAASNSAGAMTGFMGLGMMQNAATTTNAALDMLTPTPTITKDTVDNRSASDKTQEWNCNCGVKAIGKFCPECGNKKPESKLWTCKCGAKNTGKFCSECGAKAIDNICDACGFVGEGEFKFCPECGAINT